MDIFTVCQFSEASVSLTSIVFIGGAAVSTQKPSATNQEENVVVRTTAPLSTEAPPASVSEQNGALSSSGVDKTSQDLKEDISSHPVESSTDNADQESTKSAFRLPETTEAAGASASNIPSSSSAGINHVPSENQDAVESAVHDAVEPSVNPNSVNLEDKANEIEFVQSQETLESQNLATADVTEEPVSENLESGKTAVEEDDDSFESFGSGDKDEQGRAEGGSLERGSVVEKVVETPEVLAGKISLTDVWKTFCVIYHLWNNSFVKHFSLIINK